MLHFYLHSIFGVDGKDSNLELTLELECLEDMDEASFIDKRLEYSESTSFHYFNSMNDTPVRPFMYGQVSRDRLATDRHICS